MPFFEIWANYVSFFKSRFNNLKTKHKLYISDTILNTVVTGMYAFCCLDFTTDELDLG